MSLPPLDELEPDVRTTAAGRRRCRTTDWLDDLPDDYAAKFTEWFLDTSIETGRIFEAAVRCGYPISLSGMKSYRQRVKRG